MNDSAKTRNKAIGFACASLLLAASSTPAASGTWTNLVAGDASGSWAAAANWDGGTIADGANNTADFSTLDISSLSTVTLDGGRAIGNLIFDDSVPDTGWVLSTGSGGPLTLDAASPTIAVSNQAVTISAVLAGNNGFTKTGAGTLILNNTGNVGLSNHIIVAEGAVVAAANTGTMGIASDGYTAGTNSIIVVSNGATFQINGNVQINNKQLRIVGAGAGGMGAFRANAAGTTTGTRWGVGAATALQPVIALDEDATIRIDGASLGNNNDQLLLHSMDIGTNTLTKTGGGRLHFDQQNRYSGSGLVHVTEGVLSFRAGGIRDGRSLTVEAGTEARITGDNNAVNASSGLVTINGQFDLNARGNGSAGSDTTTFSQGMGGLAGSGLLTSGTFGNTGAQTLTMQTDSGDNTFAGTIRETNGKINLVKAGTNTLTLSGTNGILGLTTVNAGTLLINGVHNGAGGYLVNAGGILGGLGLINTGITNGGTIVAGDPSSPGGTLALLSSVLGTFADTVIISNATLAIDGYLGDFSFGQVGTLVMTNGTLDIPLRTGGASAFVTALNVDGSSTIKFSMDPPLVGQFPIIYAPSIGGTVGFAGLSISAPAGITASLSNNVGNQSIDVVVTAIPALTWEGSPGGLWDIGVGNWKSGATYTETAGSGPFVVFDDTAAGTKTVSLGNTLSPQGVTVDTSSTYTFTSTGKLSGPGGIAKLGSGTLTVANSGSNDLTGGVNISAGTVQVGNGGTVGNLGSGPVVNGGTLALNRSDSFALAGSVSGNGAITKAGAGTATVPVSGDSTGSVTVNAGTLLLGPSGTSKFSGDVTGGGVFGVDGAGRLVLGSFTITYSGGTLINSGTLQFGDEFGSGVFPPAGAIPNNGTLATTVSGTLANNISGTGGVTVLSNAAVTLSGANTYTGPTRVLGEGFASLTADAANYPASSVLVLGDTNAGPQIGSATFISGNPVLGGLVAGGNSTSPGNPVTLAGSGQTLTVNGSVTVGNVGPSGASALLAVSGSGASMAVVTNGGNIQIGLGTAGSGVNPDNVFVDLSALDNFSANLGSNGVINLGTLNGEPGPPAGATVVNWFKLAFASNNITAGALNVGAGGRQLTPELFLGSGTNIINVNSFNCGGGGLSSVVPTRDGSYVHFETSTGGLRLRAADGVSRAVFNLGVNPAAGTGAAITNNTVDFSGHPVDLLLSSLNIGGYNNGGVYLSTMTFDTGVIDSLSTRLSIIRNNNGNAATSLSTLNIGGGMAKLGEVSLTASAAPGTLNISGGAAVTVSNVTSAGSGTATLTIDNSTLTVDRGTGGNPSSASVAVDSLLPTGTVNLGLAGTNFVVGQFALLSYGSLGGDGYPAFTLNSLPANVSAYLSNNVANSSVDVVITAAPPATPVIDPNPTNIVVSATGGTLSLSWPSNHLGWILQAQTNALNTGLSNNWVDVPGSGSMTSTNLAINPTTPTLFFRLRYP